MFDKNNPDCLMQKWETCKNLSLWHEFTKEILDENDVKQLHYAQWQKIQNELNHLKWVKLSGTMADIIDLITSKLKFFLYHDFVKNAHAKSFQDWKSNLAKNEVLYHFDFCENYQFIPQDEIQSGHWDHQCCTLFTALVHYKDANDCLQHESFVLVSDYMNHDKFVVLVFLGQISEKFKNLHSDITITKKYFRSDSSGQHFKPKYTICSMSWIKKEIEWDFSATSHGIGDIDGLGGTCKEVHLSQDQYYPLPNWNYWKCKGQPW